MRIGHLSLAMAAVLMLHMHCAAQSPERQESRGYDGINYRSSYGILELGSPTVIDIGNYIVGGFYTSSVSSGHSLSRASGSVGVGLAKSSQMNLSYSSVGNSKTDVYDLTLALKGNILEGQIPVSVELAGSRVESLSPTDSLSVESAGVLRIIGSTAGFAGGRIIFQTGYILMSEGLPQRDRFLTGAGANLPITPTLELGVEVHTMSQPTMARGIEGGFGLQWLANNHLQIALGFQAAHASGQTSLGISLGIHVSSSEILRNSGSVGAEGDDSLLSPPPLEDSSGDSTQRNGIDKGQSESFQRQTGALENEILRNHNMKDFSMIEESKRQSARSFRLVKNHTCG